MKTILGFLLLYSSLLFSKELEINPEHSKILFDVDYMRMTTVQGQFKEYSGWFNLSGTESEIFEVKVVIKSASVDTNEPKRDFHVKGQEFFLVSTYPDIVFEAKGPAVINFDKTFKIKGQLTLRGIKKEVTLAGIYKGKMIDPWKKENYFLEMSTEINRQDFGMKWNKQLDSGGYLVGDMVRIKITLQAQVHGDKTAFSTHMIPTNKAIIERDQLKRGIIKKLTTSTDPLDHLQN